jgi:hypothetical protein
MVYLVQKGTAGVPREISGASWAVQAVLTLWAACVLPVFAAIVTSLLASVEHHNRGLEHVFALPIARGALIAAKLAASLVLVGIAHLSLGACTLAMLWSVSRFAPASGLEASLPVAPLIVVVAACAAATPFLVAVHTLLALRWHSFALDVGLALTALLGTFVVLETPLRSVYPWSLPGAALTIAVPWVFDWPGAVVPPEWLALPTGVSAAGFVLTSIGGGWLVARRDV